MQEGVGEESETRELKREGEEEERNKEQDMRWEKQMEVYRIP